MGATPLDPTNSRAQQQRGQVDELLRAMPAASPGYDFARAMQPQHRLSWPTVRLAFGVCARLASIVGVCVGIFTSSQDLIGISIVGFIVGIWIGKS